MKTSGSKRIAERYVKALFEASAASLSKVESDMASLAKALKESAELSNFLVNPLPTNDQRVNVMSAILDKIGATDITRQFVATLIKQKRLPILAAITEEFSAVTSAARGELAAEIITASAMSDKEITTIADRLSKAYGRTLRLAVKQDASLLGGVVLRIGSQQLDSSLAGKLRRLKNSLKAA